MRFTYLTPERARTINLTELDELAHATAFYYNDIFDFPVGQTLEILRWAQFDIYDEDFPCTYDGVKQRCAGQFDLDHGVGRFSLPPGSCLSSSALVHEWSHIILWHYVRDNDYLHEFEPVWKVAVPAIRTQTTKEYCDE